MQIKKQIPNLLTLGNLVCGVLAIITLIYAVGPSHDYPRDLFKLNGFKPQFEFATPFYFILAGLLFDLLDGAVARLLRVNSEVGIQLDSLADMVTFGVAPAIFILAHYRSLLDTHIGGGLSYLAFFTFVLFLACAALRLAKFNVSVATETRFFKGLPTPAAAIAIIGIPFTYHSRYLNNIDIPQLIELFGNKPAFLLWSIIIANLMVSPIPLFSFKFKNFSWADNWFRYILIGIAIALLVWLKLAALPIIILIYILMSVLFKKTFVVSSPTSTK